MHTSAGETEEAALNLGSYPVGAMLNFTFTLKEDVSWAKAGHIVAQDQIALALGYAEPAVCLPRNALSMEKTHSGCVVKGQDFAVSFNREGMSGLVFHNVNLLESGLKPNLWRAPTDNDQGWPSIAKKWEELGLNRLLCRNDSFGASLNDHGAVIEISGVYGQKVMPPLLRITQKYTVTSEGKIALDITYAPLREIAEYLPRLGLRLEMPAGFDRLIWQGRGPHESYPDKKTGAPIGRYESTVDETHEPYVRPQENGAHEDTRFAALLNNRGIGLLASSKNFSFSAHHYTPEMLTAAQHTIELGRTDSVTWLIDGAMGPLGTASCGPEPLEEDRLYLKEPRSFRFCFLPFDAETLSVDGAAKTVC